MKKPDQRRQKTASIRSRRRLPLVILAALIVLAGAAWWLLRDTRFTLEPGGNRNVLLVTIDTLRADALSAYGGRAHTPNLDALAARGARFTFAHSHAVVTLPSHTTLMSGEYPYQHGVRDNNGFRVRSGQVTLATRLKSAGFATGAFVGAFPLDQRFGLGAGFDVYDDRVEEMGSSIDFALPDRRADAVVKPALDWIAAQRGKWFAWVHVFDPHAPYRPPSPFAERYAGEPYSGEVAWTDFALGPLFERLRSLDRPTIVVVTADHGESLGEHGEATHGIFGYEATLRVPLIVADIEPTRADQPRGVVIDAAVRHVDVVPTILDALAIARDGTLQGVSLLDTIARRGAEDRPTYFEAMTANLSRGWAPLRGVIAGGTKYIHLPLPELYDLASDAREQHDLADRDAGRTAALLELLRSFDLAPPQRPGEETAAVRDRLRALGYLGGSPAPPRDGYGEADDPKRLIDVDALLHRAGDLYESKRLPEAAAAFQDVIRRRPDMADAYRYLAFVYWQGGRTEDAIATLEAALKRGISHRDIRVKLGVYLAQTGRAERAIALLEGLTEDDVEALNSLGIAYGQAERTGEAFRTFNRVLELDATNGLAHQNIGTLQLRSGDSASAEASFRRALAIDGTLHGALTALGVVLSEKGQKQEAVDMWQRALAIEESDLDALYNLTVTLAELGRTDESRKYGERYVAAAPRELYARDIERVLRLISAR